MKKNTQNFFIFFLILFSYSTILTSCSEEIYENLNKQEQTTANILSIKQAKEWYDSSFVNVKKSHIFKVKTSDTSTLDLKPLLDWDLAKMQNDTAWSVVELPWNYDNIKMSIANSEVRDYAITNSVNANYVYKLVVLLNRKTGQKYGFKMIILPDLDYMIKVGDNLSKNSYLKKESDLSGSAFFYTISDEFVNGWQYKDGKIIGKIINNSQVVNDKKSKVKKFSDLVIIETTYCWWQDVTTKRGTYTDHYCETSHNYVYLSSNLDFPSGGNSTGSVGGFDTQVGGGAGGSISNNDAMIKTDCKGIAGGKAYIDNCNECVGGTTGKSPCKQDCLGVWGGKAYWNNECSTCINGNVGKFNITLTGDALNRFNSIISLMKQNCIDNELLNALKSNAGITIGFGITTVANYNPCTQTVSFKNSDDISTFSLRAELFHAFQNQYYNNEVSKMYKDIANSHFGGSNLEFEEKAIYLYQKAIGNAWGTYPKGTDKLELWIKDLIKNHTVGNITLSVSERTSWFTALESFKSAYSNSTNLYSSPIDYNRLPIALLSLIEKCAKN